MTLVSPLPAPPPEGVHRKRIEVRDLAKSYRKTPVVNGVSLYIEQGEIVALLGPNGAGKTTTFYMIMGLIRPNGGRVLFEDTDITHLPMYLRARRGIGYLAQQRSVFLKLTARENIVAVLEMVGYKGNQRKRADELLDEMGILDKADTKGYYLSGGECRRVEIARALSANPAFLLLDEPFASIDPLTVDEIQGVVGTLRDRGIGILITDHDARATLRLAERAYILADGKVVASGTAQEIANNPTARKHYLGENFTL